jgi:serine/threonine protein phosphatase 1
MEWKQLPGESGDDHIFAIGDVHGQDKALEVALRAIAETPHNGRQRRLIFTGDIIDRGPGNLKCIDMVMNAARLADVDKVDFIVGNHELMFLDSVRNPVWSMNLWSQNGGYALIEECDPDRKLQKVDDIARMLTEKLSGFIDFLDASHNHLFVDDLLFVHAGIHPHIDIKEFLAQDRSEIQKNHWAWIREPFLHAEGPWSGHENLTVIHGHTPHNFGQWIDPAEVDYFFDLVETHGRICLDAGAMSKGQLVLLEMREGEYRMKLQQSPAFNPNYDLNI